MKRPAGAKRGRGSQLHKTQLGNIQKWADHSNINRSLVLFFCYDMARMPWDVSSNYSVQQINWLSVRRDTQWPYGSEMPINI